MSETSEFVRIKVRRADFPSRPMTLGFPPTPKARTQDVVVEHLDDELVVYDKRNQAAHALSSEAAAVWQSCNGERSVDELAAELGLEPAVVEHALDALRSSELLDEPTLLDGLVPRYSRRQAAVRFATAGAAAFLAPFVYSVSIAAAQGCTSCTPQGTLPNGTDLGKGVASCTGTGGSGTKGCDCKCASGTCYEGTGNEDFCVPANCIPGGMSAGGLCSNCCAGKCTPSGVTCAATGPGQ
jgi:DNA-binding transcriptional ArsR family regulator